MAELRDHSQPCDHEKATPTERFRGHRVHNVLSAWGIGTPDWCPGGREVTDDTMAWVVIANASDWILESKHAAEWREAAERWRDAYFASLSDPVV